MEIKAILNLSEYQLIELKRLAQEAGTDINGVVGGIVQLYLSGKVQGRGHDLVQDRFVKDVLQAVTRLQGQRPTQTQQQPRGRSGRPALLSQAQVAMAVDLRAQGATYATIGEQLDVGEWVVRRALREA